MPRIIARRSGNVTGGEFILLVPQDKMAAIK